MKLLQTVLVDADGVPVENATTDMTSFAECRLKVQRAQAIHPGCKMLVWRRGEDPMKDSPREIEA